MAGSDLLGLLQQHTRLRCVASGQYGHEYGGPCPFCGGRDRLRVWPDHPQGPRWRCLGHKAGRNGCGRGGDAIAFLVELGKITPQEAGRMRREEGGAPVIIGTPVPVGHRQEPAKPSPVDPSPRNPPPVAWWEQARVFVNYCHKMLFSDAGRAGLDWLHGRGLRDETIERWRLGWHEKDRWRDPARWGLDGGRRVWLPRGVVIPWVTDGMIWHVKVRRFDNGGPLTGSAKYPQVRDGIPTLYGLDLITGKRAVAICEGELDAVLLQQEAGDLVDVVALGSKGSRVALRYLARLQSAARWLIALDADADEQAAIWTRYSPRARRMRPLQSGDVTEFHQSGGDLRAWVRYHLEIVR